MQIKIDEIETDRYILEVFECGCGFHIGVDSTYLDQVGIIAFPCPACGAKLVFPETDMCPTCIICGHPCDKSTAHPWRGKYIGHECCWENQELKN